jgi:hypothetical protein
MRSIVAPFRFNVPTVTPAFHIPYQADTRKHPALAPHIIYLAEAI